MAPGAGAQGLPPREVNMRLSEGLHPNEPSEASHGARRVVSRRELKSCEMQQGKLLE